MSIAKNLITRPLNPPGLVNYQGVVDAAPIRVSKKLPNNVANLAYIHGKEITPEDVSIVGEQIPALSQGVDYQTMHVFVHYPFDFNALDFDDLDFGNEDSQDSVVSEFCDSSGSRDFRHGYALLTSEFSIPLSASDTAEPLFYKHTLLNPIDIGIWGSSCKLIPFPYGHATETEEALSLKETATGSVDRTPMVYREIRDLGYSSLISFSKKDGSPIRSGFKVLLTQDSVGWKVTVYHSFSSEDEITVRYCGLGGKTHVEAMGFSPIFNYGTDFTVSPQENGYFKVEQQTMPNQVIEGPMQHDGPFQYRIVGSVSRQYGPENPLNIKVGMLCLNPAVNDAGISILFEKVISESTGLFAQLHANTLEIMPEYITLENPHPKSIYLADETLDNLQYLEEYKQYQDYWWIDSTMPKEYWMDYDIIYVSGTEEQDIGGLEETFREYIDKGGRLIFDGDASTAGGMAINTEDTYEDIISYEVEGADAGAKSIPATLPFMTKVHDLAQVDQDSIGLNSEDYILSISESAQGWTTLLKNDKNEPLVLGRIGIHGRGYVVLSSAALGSGAVSADPSASQKFLVNLFVWLMEQAWVGTPWLSGTVMPAQLLRAAEFEKEGYRMDVHPTNPSAQMVARRQIAQKTIDFVNFYTRQKDTEGTFYPQYTRAGEIYMDEQLDANSPLESIHFDTIRERKYRDWDVEYPGYIADTLYSQTTAQAILVPCTQRWSVLENQLYLETVEADYAHCKVITATVSKTEGMMNLGLLAPALPALPSGREWADKSKVYYKIYGWDDDLKTKTVSPVSFGFYNPYSGEHYYSSSGEYQIRHTEVFSSRVVTDGNRTIERTNSEDIILYAQTDAYAMCRYASVYAIKPITPPNQIVTLPANLTTNECWHPLVHRMSFVKDSFTDSDYERIAKVVGFKYDPEYLIEQARNYFGRVPTDNAVASAIGKLAGSAEIGWDDLQSILEAIRVVEPGWLFQYYTPEYEKQIWLTGTPPYKKIYDETPSYVDSHTIRTNRSPLAGLDSIKNVENFSKLTESVYVLPDRGISRRTPFKVVIRDVDDDLFTIFPDDLNYPYAIHYDAGLLSFTGNTPTVASVEYTVENLMTRRQTHKTTGTRKFSMTTVVPNRVYALTVDGTLSLLQTPAPIVSDASHVLSPGEYNIDFEHGLVFTKIGVDGALTITANCEKMELLHVDWIDTLNGIVRLKETIHFHDDLRVNYLYEENRYEYRGYMDEETSTFVRLDLNPTRGHISTVPSDDIYKTAIPEADARLNERNGWMDVETYSLVDKSVYLYMLPYRTYHNGEATGAARADVLRHTWSRDRLEAIQLAHPEVIVLAELRITDPWTVFDTTVLDARSEGGRPQQQPDPKEYSLWDITPVDGLEIHPNGTAVIRLPKSVLARNGGKFTEAEVEAVVREHLAAGVVPIILYEDIETPIILESLWNDEGTWNDSEIWDDGGL